MLKVSNRFKGFSLIELLVVLVIIALLSASAIPVYKSYMIKSRIATVIPVFEKFLENSMEYALGTNVFANAYNLGLSATNGSTTADATLTANISPYLQTSVNGGVVAQDLSGCGAEGIVKFWLKPSALGLDASVATFDMFCYLYFYNATINKACFYEYYNNDGSSGTQQDLISQWYNVNTGTGSDGNNLQTYLYSTTQWIHKTCQK